LYPDFTGRFIAVWQTYKNLTKHSQALIKSRRDPSYKHILDATYSIVFFGTPHQGMRTNELEEMLDAKSSSYEMSRHKLLEQLIEGLEWLEYHKKDLSYIWKEYKPKIVSFYVTALMPPAERVGLHLSLV
jgi:hypothetical protein